MFPCNHCGNQTKGTLIGHARSRVCPGCSILAGHQPAPEPGATIGTPPAASKPNLGRAQGRRKAAVESRGRSE